MCLVLAFLVGALAFNFYQSGELSAAIVAGIVSLGFVALMVRNIRAAIKRKRDDH